MELSVEALDWRREEEKKFAALSCLDCKYLCICGTSVPSERLFSDGRNIVNTLRNR